MKQFPRAHRCLDSGGVLRLIMTFLWQAVKAWLTQTQECQNLKGAIEIISSEHLILYFFYALFWRLSS